MFRAYVPITTKHYLIVSAILLVATSNMCDILKQIKSNFTLKLDITFSPKVSLKLSHCTLKLGITFSFKISHIFDVATSSIGNIIQ
jgi:hypothetical protein